MELIGRINDERKIMSSEKMDAGYRLLCTVPALFAAGLSMLPEHAVQTAFASQDVPAARPLGRIAKAASVETLPEMAKRLESRRTGSREHECLARTVYFEARGERLNGQIAVAQVVLNRTRSDYFPNDVCQVVREDGQFSFVTKGMIPSAPTDEPAWSRAVAVSKMVLLGRGIRFAEKALFFHATYVSSEDNRPRIGRMGGHVFYR